MEGSASLRAARAAKALLSYFGLPSVSECTVKLTRDPAICGGVDGIHWPIRYQLSIENGFNAFQHYFLVLSSVG